MRTVVVALSLAGCSFPTKPGPPFACVGDTPPSTAPPAIKVSGTVFKALTNDPVPGATVTGRGGVGSAAVETFTATADATGWFTSTVPTGGSPHAGFLQSSLAPDYLDTYTYLALPVAGDTIVALQQFTQEQIDSYVAAGLPAIATGTAPLIVSIVDCNAEPIAGATLTIKPSSPSNFRVTYLNGRIPNTEPSARVTDMTGTAFVTGLSPGDVMVGATMGTTPFQGHTVYVTAGAITLTEVSP